MESLRVTVPEIWPGQDRGGKKRKKKKKKKKKELAESHKASPRGSLIIRVIVIIIKIIIIIIITIIIIIIITRQVLGRPVCDRGAIPRTLVLSNKMVRRRLIILINEEINKANWMVSNSAKLDRRTKQHTQFGVSASNGSRDMARTKSWRKKEKKNK